MDMFEYYGLFREEHGADRLQIAESRIIEHLFDKYLPAEGRVIDTAAGTGTFAFRFAELGYKVTAGDLLEEHVSEIRANPKCATLENTYCASPKNLAQFENESFDILISMGPVYHMKTRQERESFLKESLRVLKPDGYIAFTFMTPTAMTLGQYFKAMRTSDTLERLKAYRTLAQVQKTGNVGMFNASTLDEMTEMSREYSIDILTVASTYGMLYNMVGEVDKMTDEEFEKFLLAQYATCEDPFVARFCMRGIFIGRKRQRDMFD